MSHADSISQESQVHQRISELRKEGQWSASRLPKLVEASRPKSHWDYLLEEMQWMAADFAQERRWKEAAAKKVWQRWVNSQGGKIHISTTKQGVTAESDALFKANCLMCFRYSLFARVPVTIKSRRKVKRGQRKKGKFIFVTLPAQLPERWNSSGQTLSRYVYLFFSIMKPCHDL